MGGEEDVVVPIRLEVENDPSGQASFKNTLAGLKKSAEEVNKILERSKTTTQALSEGLKATSSVPGEISRKLKQVSKELRNAQAEMEWVTREMTNRQTTGQPGTQGKYQNLTDEQLFAEAARQKQALDELANKYNEYKEAARRATDSAVLATQNMSIQQRTELHKITQEFGQAIEKYEELKKAADTDSVVEKHNKDLKEQKDIIDDLKDKYDELKKSGTSAQEAIEQSTQKTRETTRKLGKEMREAARAAKSSNGSKTGGNSKNDNFGGNVMNRQVYYNLRQLRLVQSELDRINNNLKKVTKAMVTSLKKVTKAVVTLALGFTNLRKSTDGLSKANKGFGKGLSSNLWTILRYTIGIRSLFALTNRLRTALSQGMQNLALYADYANQQMSSLATSMLYLKNAVAAAAQPLLNVLAPALEFVSEKIADLLFNVGQLIAALTGQSFVYKAKRAQVDYAKSLGKTADEAERLNDALGQYDKLEVIGQDKDKGATDDGMPSAGEMFETISPISDKIKALADKIKDILSQLFAPIKAAWEKEGQFVIDSWKYALEEVWALIKSIGRDFLIMWNEEATIKMWEDIFHIVGDVGLIIGNLAHGIREAWDANETGLRIWEGLRDILAAIIHNFRELADYTVEWSANLDFTPLLTSFADLLQALVPVADFLSGVVVDMIENIFLEYIQYLIEEGIPKLNDTLASIAEAVHWDELREALKPLWEALEHLMEVSFDGLVSALGVVGDAVARFVNSESFNLFLENLAKFITDFADTGIIETVFEAIGLAILKIVEALVDFVNSEPFQNFLQFLLNWLSEMNADQLSDLFVAIAGFIITMKGIFSVVKWITNAATFFNTLKTGFGILKTVVMNPIVEIITGAIMAVAAFVDMLKNGWSIAKEILKDVGIVLVAIGAIVLGAPALVAAVIAAIVAAVTTLIVVIKDHWEDIKAFFGRVKESIANFWEAVKERFERFKADIKVKFEDFKNFWKTELNNLKTLASTAFNGIKTVISTILNTIKNAISTALNAIKSTWTKVFTALKTTTSNIFNGIWNAIKGVINKILGGIESMANGVIHGINGMINALNGLSFDVPDWIPGIGGSTFGFSIPTLSEISLPRLAQGAVIPPNKEFAAVLGDQKQGVNIETPLDTMVEAFKKALAEEGGSNHEDIVLQLDGKQVARVVWNETEKKYKQTGRYIPQMA